MTLRDLKDRLIGLFGKPVLESSSRPDGGTSCYRPTRRRNEAAEGPEARPAQGAEQPIAYAHTGFTGMNPPADSTGYGQSAGYFRHDGAAQPGSSPYGDYSGMYSGNYSAGSFAEPRQAAPAQNPQANSGAYSNISYMPGVYAQDAGSSYTHVEHILTMTSLKTCYEAIACMKNGETLIVTMNAIANESEAMRCQDMLAGAAFTLGCNVRMLNGAGIVLIAPENVKILPEQQPSARPEGMPLFFNMPQQPAPQPAQAENRPRRERRVSPNTAEFEAARSGRVANYNPYTGSMPAAAGDYRSFGGYGY